MVLVVEAIHFSKYSHSTSNMDNWQIGEDMAPSTIENNRFNGPYNVGNDLMNYTVNYNMLLIMSGRAALRFG
jgi:hypothetical protein